MHHQDIIAGVDIGSTKICAVIGQLNDVGAVDIWGYGELRHSGVKNGIIVDMEQVSEAVEKAVLEAEEMSRQEVHSFLINISGQHVCSEDSTASVAIKHYDHKVRRIDLYQVLQKARQVNCSEMSEIVQVMVNDYSLDQEGGVKSPLGMVASELGVRARVFTAKRNCLHNLVNTVQLMGMHVDAIYPSAVLAADAVLAYEEKELGVACVDIGGGTVDVAVYDKGAIVFSCSLARGMDVVADQVSHKLCISLEHAREIIEKYGFVGAVSPGQSQEIVYEHIGGERLSKIDSDALRLVIEEEVKAILDELSTALRDAGMLSLLAAGVVLTGGAAHVRGLSAFAAHHLGVPARLGSVMCAMSAHGTMLKGSEYAVASGLISLGAKGYAQQALVSPGRMERLKCSVGHFLSDLF